MKKIDKYDSIINEPINVGHNYKYFVKKYHLKVWKGSPRVPRKKVPPPV